MLVLRDKGFELKEVYCEKISFYSFYCHLKAHIDWAQGTEHFDYLHPVLESRGSQNKCFERETLDPKDKNYLVKSIGSTISIITILIFLNNTPTPDLIIQHLE